MAHCGDTKVQYNAQDTTQCWSLPAEDYAPSVQTGELEIMTSGLAACRFVGRKIKKIIGIGVGLS